MKKRRSTALSISIKDDFLQRHKPKVHKEWLSWVYPDKRACVNLNDLKEIVMIFILILFDSFVMQGLGLSMLRLHMEADAYMDSYHPCHTTHVPFFQSEEGKDGTAETSKTEIPLAGIAPATSNWKISELPLS